MSPELMRKVTRMNLLALALGHFIFAGFIGFIAWKLIQRQRTGAAMSIDFDRLIHVGGTFTGTAATFDAYKEWLKTTSCMHCGAKYADRERDAEGKYKQWWLTEVDCGCRMRAAPSATGERHE